MEHTAFILRVREDRMEEYKEHHKAVWPEMLEALRRHGWNNYSLFLSEDGLLFGYLEPAADFQQNLDGMVKEDVNNRWQEFMAPFFEKLEGRPDQSMVRPEQVFYLE